jgi:hypothetical protein
LRTVPAGDSHTRDSKLRATSRETRQIESFLKSIEEDYDVRVPVSLHDSTRSLGNLGEDTLAIAGGRGPKKITDVFFPQIDNVLAIGCINRNRKGFS